MQFLSNDQTCFDRGLRFELGLKVPEDVSVVGFDDIPAAAGAQPADLSLLADIMFDRLMKLTEGNDGTHATTLPPPGH